MNGMAYMVAGMAFIVISSIIFAALELWLHKRKKELRRDEIWTYERENY